MAMQVEDAIDIYRELANYAEVKSARVSNGESPGHVQIYSEWRQRDIERSENIKFSRTHLVQLDVILTTPPNDISTEERSTESPSGKWRTVLRKIKDKKGEDKQFIEVWSDTQKLHNVDVERLEEHGKVYEDDQFGCLEWSLSETHLLYVAEKKKPKRKSFFEKRLSAGESGDGSTTSTTGDEFVYEEEWGEQLVGKSRPVLCVLDIQSGLVSTLDNFPDDISPGQAVWCPDDLGIVCVGWFNEAYRLGHIYCPMRRSALFYVDLKTFKSVTLTAVDKSVRSPVFSPDQSKLIYLENNAGGPHSQCSRLIMCDWSTKGLMTVIDVVRSAKSDEFPGLYLNGLNRRCWLEDNKHVVLESLWRCKKELILVDCENGKLKRLTNDSMVGSWNLNDVKDNLIVATISSPNQPHLLCLGRVALDSVELVKWTRLDVHPPPLIDFSWKSFSIQVPPQSINKNFANLDYDCILLEPFQTDEMSKPPLVVYVHGGPHSSFIMDWQLYFAGLCKVGYVVLLVNYRGSVGCGQDSIDSLLGNIGTQDVQDCQFAVEKILAMDIVDKGKIAIIGGSHGGFLAAHLIGQFPDIYKAAVVRNPVIDLVSLFPTSDIPDWCITECGLTFNFTDTLSVENSQEFLRRSPILYVDKITTPVMIMLGADDLRVPTKQGHELRKALQARNVPVRTLCYPGNCHPLSKVDSEADAFINIIKWFNEHLGFG